MKTLTSIIFAFLYVLVLHFICVNAFNFDFKTDENAAVYFVAMAVYYLVSFIYFNQTE